MKRWRVIIVSFAALGIIVFCWISIIASRPPTYAGKSLGYWLEQYRNSGQSDVPDENDWQYEWLGDESLAAMRAMGPKAVSYLLRTAFYQKSDTAISRTYYKVVSKLPQSWNLPGQQENPARLSFVAYVALEHLRPLQELVLPAIQKALTDTNGGVRSKAIRLCGRLQGDSAKVMPILMTALTNSHGEPYYPALFALWDLGAKGSAAAPALVDALHRQVQAHRFLNRDELFVLGQMGSNANSALPDLKRLFLAETNINAKSYYATAMCQIDGNQTAALDFLINCLNDQTRTNYVTDDIDRLGLIGPNARLAIPALLEKLNETNLAAAKALKAVGAPADQYMPRMKNYLKSDDVGIRVGAAAEILRVDPTDREAQVVLVNTIEITHDPSNLLTAINALLKGGEPARISLVEAHQALNRRTGETQSPDKNLVLSAKHIAFMMEAQDAAKLNNASR